MPAALLSIYTTLLDYSKNTKPENDLNRELLNPNSKVYNYTNEIQNDNSIFPQMFDQMPVKSIFNVNLCY